MSRQPYREEGSWRQETGNQLSYAPWADQRRLSCSLSVSEPETESKLSGYPCRVDLPGGKNGIGGGAKPPLEIDYS